MQNPRKAWQKFVVSASTFVSVSLQISIHIGKGLTGMKLILFIAALYDAVLDV